MSDTSFQDTCQEIIRLLKEDILYHQTYPPSPPPSYTVDPIYPMYDPYYMYPASQPYAYPPSVPYAPPPPLSVPYAPPPPLSVSYAPPPPPSVPYAQPPPLQPTCTPQYTTMQPPTSDGDDYISLVGSCDVDEPIDIVDDARDDVDESIAEVVEDDLQLTLEPMTYTPEAQDEPETIFHVHCTDVGQVCTFVNFNDSLTNVASLALDEKINMSTISHVYVSMRAIIRRWYRDLKIMQDLRTNPFQERENDAHGPSPKQPTQILRPTPKPPWSLESPPSILSLGSHVSAQSTFHSAKQPKSMMSIQPMIAQVL